MQENVTTDDNIEEMVDAEINSVSSDELSSTRLS